MDILITIGAKVAEYAIVPIGRQVGYLFFYNKNIKDVEQQLKILEAIRMDVQRRVNEATGNGDEIRTEVSTWLGDVDAKLPNITQRNPSCFNFIQRHQLSRETKKRVKIILDLIDKGNKFEKVGDPAPLPDTKSFIPSDDYQILESRTRIAKKIKDALANPNVNKVGVYGMGGVGKTKLLDEVKKLVLKDKLFDRVIEVVVGQSNGEVGIQEQIGNKLHIKLPKSKEGRASFLRNKLAKMEDNILVMLDDLWKEYDLIKEVGIPCRSKLSKEGCKILMTSRFRDKLINNMNVEMCFEVKSLSEEESWNFFMTIIGDNFDTNQMEHIAKEVVKKCGGLPIALKIIAKALKGKDLRIWKDALKQLENPISVNIDGVSDQLYSLLKLSYNWIKSEAQLLFLLCSVFPDDHWIDLEKLQIYTMGMRLLNEVNTWEEAKNRVIQLVDHLKSSSLLLEAKNNCVKMHDVVRDVAKYIASDEGKMSILNYRSGQSEWQEKDRCHSYNAIFVDCNDNVLNLPQNLKTPKLELLILKFPWRRHQSLPNSDVFFEGMEELKVLDLSCAYHQPLWTSLTHSLKNLRMLYMTFCEFNDIDTIGQLKNLEILKISWSRITELPATMSELTQLKVLDVTNCFNLEVIPANILSSMTKLESLKLWWSFKRWGEEVWYKDKWIKNAKLSELNGMSRLSNLTLEIPKVDVLLDDLTLVSWKLEEFCISVGDRYHGFKTHDSATASLMLCNIQSQIASINGVLEILLQGCENLYAISSVSFANDLFKPNGNCGYPHLKHLNISENANMRYLIEDMDFSYFTSLESLNLIEMKSLESIVPMHALTIPFRKLQTIKLSRCEKLRNLFSFSIFKGLLVLQEIEIDECGMMDGIVFVGNKESTITIECTHLTSLKLHNVHQLTSFCTKQSIHETPECIIPFFDDQVSFPNLKDLSISGVHNLEILWHNNGLTANCLWKLQTLELHNCNKLRYVFPSNMVKSLVLLRTLKISFCELLERIFEVEPLIVKKNEDARVVPLANLSLSYLPNLKYVWDKDPDGFLIFPSLNKVHVTDCPRLKSVFPASFVKYLQQIKSLNVHDLDEMFPEGTTSNSTFPEIFPSLRSLGMGCICKAIKRSFWVRSEFFLKLESLSLIGSEDDDMTTLPLEMSEALYRNDRNYHGHGNLKRLDLCNFPKLKHMWRNNNQTTASFYSLTELQVGDCNGMMNLFSSLVAKRLVNLKSIKIYSCGGMISMVAVEQEGEEEIGEIIFNKLTNLKFKNLPRLASFHSGKCTVKFPCLNELKIDGCPKMETFSYGTISMPILEYMKIGKYQRRPDFREVLKEDSSDVEENNLALLGQQGVNLKDLDLNDVPKLTHVWTDNTQTTTSSDSLEYIYARRCENLKCLLPSSISFFNLHFILVSHCDGMMNLFSSTIAKNLVNLSNIVIFYCGGMSCIVEAEGEEENDEIVFNRLTELRIMCLPSLVSFHSGKCRLNFPYLSRLEIKECPKMKTFSYGVISAPYLHFIETQGKRVGVSPTGGINTSLSKTYSRKWTHRETSASHTACMHEFQS